MIIPKIFLKKIAYSRQSSLQELYLNLKQKIEGKSEGIGDLESVTPLQEIPDLTSATLIEDIGDLPSATHIVAIYEEPIQPFALEKHQLHLLHEHARS